MRAAGKVMPALADLETFLPPEPPRPPVWFGWYVLVFVGVCETSTNHKTPNTNISNTRHALMPLAPALPALVALLPVPDMVLVGWWLEVSLPVGWVGGGVMSCGVRRKQ